MFVAPPEFKEGAAAKNVYSVTVVVSDGSLSTSKTIVVTVADNDRRHAYGHGAGGDKDACPTGPDLDRVVSEKTTHKGQPAHPQSAREEHASIDLLHAYPSKALPQCANTSTGEKLRTWPAPLNRAQS